MTAVDRILSRVDDALEYERAQTSSQTDSSAGPDGRGSVGSPCDAKRVALEAFAESLQPDDVAWVVYAGLGRPTAVAATAVFNPEDVYAFRPPSEDTATLEFVLHDLALGAVEIVRAKLASDPPDARIGGFDAWLRPDTLPGMACPASVARQARSVPAPDVIHLDVAGREAEFLEAFSIEQLEAVREWVVAVYDGEFRWRAEFLGLTVSTLSEWSDAEDGPRRYVRVTGGR